MSIIANSIEEVVDYLNRNQSESVYFLKNEKIVEKDTNLENPLIWNVSVKPHASGQKEFKLF